MQAKGNIPHGPVDQEALRSVDNLVFELLLKAYVYKIPRKLRLLSTYNIDLGSINTILSSTFHALFSYLCISMRKLSDFICMIKAGTYNQN